MKERQKNVDAARAEYNEALKAYNDEVELAKAGQSTIEAARTFADKAAAKLALLDQAQGFLGIEVASEERIKRINDLLSSLKAGTALNTEDASKAELVASMLPLLADDMRAIAQARKGRALVPAYPARYRTGQPERRRRAGGHPAQGPRAAEAIVEAALDQAVTYAVARRRISDLMSCSSADLVVACSAFTPSPGHGGEDGLAEMERVCRPGGCVAIIWPNHLAWLTARGYRHVSFPGPMSVEFGSHEEAVELAEIFYPKAADERQRRGWRKVPFAALGIKVEQIEKILNLLGIFYIGYGVNN
jgi:hypothetical protein